MPFPFEKLIVYQRSQEFLAHIHSLASERKSMPRFFSDQLSRAALSIALNIAEGNGRWHRAEKRQFFWIARGSVFECVAILQTLVRQERIEADCYRKLYGQLEELGKMLTSLIKSVEALDRTNGVANERP